MHADLKPDNVLLTEDKARCKICDFGTAMHVPDGIIRDRGVQPRYYRAPEVCTFRKTVFWGFSAREFDHSRVFANKFLLLA